MKKNKINKSHRRCLLPSLPLPYLRCILPISSQLERRRRKRCLHIEPPTLLPPPAAPPPPATPILSAMVASAMGMDTNTSPQPFGPPLSFPAVSLDIFNSVVVDKNLVFKMSPEVEAITSFDQMGIRDNLLHGIYTGFKKPSARSCLLRPPPWIDPERLVKDSGRDHHR